MKKLLATLLLGAALAVGALPASAAGNDGTVTMQPEGDRAAVSLALPQGADQDATALRLSFQVEGGDAAASFIFDEGLTSTVQQYRFDATTGVLTLYLAGADPLLQDGSVELGELCLSAGQGATATVSVVEDSLELVNAAYSKAGVTHATGAEITLTVPGSNPAPEQTPVPETQPEQTPAPETKPEQTPAPEAQPQQTPAPTPAPGGGNAQSSKPQTGTTTQSGGKTQGSSNPGSSPTPTPVVSTTPVSTAAPAATAPAAVATTQSGKGSSTGKGSGGSKATPAPTASPEPSATPAPSASPAPSATPTATPAAQTAETAQPLQEGNGGLPLPLVIAVVVVLAALLGVGIFRLRNR